MGLWETVQIILVLAVIFYLTWLATRLIARSKGKVSGRFMRVVDRLNISNDKAILIVKMGGEYCAIGVTGHEMRLLKTLDEAQAEVFQAGEAKAGEGWQAGSPADAVWKGMQSFSSRLGMAMKRPGGRKPRDDASPAEPSAGSTDDQSVIDMMNERIKLRKDSKWR